MAVSSILARNQSLESLLIHNCTLTRNPLAYILQTKRPGFSLELVREVSATNQTYLRLEEALDLKTRHPHFDIKLTNYFTHLPSFKAVETQLRQSLLLTNNFIEK